MTTEFPSTPCSYEHVGATRIDDSGSSSASSPDNGTPDTSPTEDVDNFIGPKVQRSSEKVFRPPLRTSTPASAIVPTFRRLPVSPLTFDAVDPFGQVPVQITEQMHHVLQETLRVYPFSGNNYKLAHLPKHMRGSINQFPIHEVVRKSVFKKHHLFALLATISSRIQGLYGGANTEQPRLFRASAAKYLRTELIRSSTSGEVDKHTILDILFLCVSEMAAGQYDSARTHLGVVTKMFAMLDTNQHFDFWVSETAAHVDNQLALSTGTRPVLPFDFDPPPMLPERMAMLNRELRNLLVQGLTPRIWVPNPTTLMMANAPVRLRDAIADFASTIDLRMGSRFEIGLQMGIFNAQMGKIIRDMIDCVNIAKVVYLSPLAVCFDAEWLCRKARAVLRALLAIAPENSMGPMDMLGKCMESCRLGLLIMMSHACTLIGFQTARQNVYRLQKAMAWALEFWCCYVGLTDECKPLDDRIQEPVVIAQLGFVLWTNVVGVWSSMGDAIERFFLVRAVNICRLMGFKTYEDLDNHMSYYLYSKTLQEASLRRIITSLQEG